MPLLPEWKISTTGHLGFRLRQRQGARGRVGRKSREFIWLLAFVDSVLIITSGKGKKRHMLGKKKKKRIKERKQDFTFFPCNPKTLQTQLLWTT